jgi:hypothetical protein
MELLTQIRPNACIFNHPAAAAWNFKYPTWPRDIDIRQNMVSMTWTNISTLISGTEAQVITSTGDLVDQETVTNTMQEVNIAAPFRFIIIIGGD